MKTKVEYTLFQGRKYSKVQILYKLVLDPTVSNQLNPILKGRQPQHKRTGCIKATELVFVSAHEPEFKHSKHIFLFKIIKLTRKKNTTFSNSINVNSNILGLLHSKEKAVVVTAQKKPFQFSSRKDYIKRKRADSKKPACYNQES